MPPAMPPSQGSRAALISALVVSVILAVAMMITTFYGYQKWNQADQALQELGDKHKPYVTDANIADARVETLKGLRDQPAFAGTTTVIDVALSEVDQISKVIGTSAPPDRMADAARLALADAAKRIDDLNAKKLVSFTLPKDTFIPALAALVDQVDQLSHAKQDLTARLDEASKKNQDLAASQKKLLDDKDEQIKNANAMASKSADEAKAAHDEAVKSKQDAEASGNAEIKKAQDANAALTAQLQSKDKLLVASNKKATGLLTKLHQARVTPKEAIVQHPDGDIIRVNEGKTVFINLGQRQHVSKGLTFEVYDKAKGIPALGDGLTENGLPVGKASIEVFNVGSDTSECRIVKVQPGQAIVIGDIIANLIYDPSNKYNFFVFGNFDLTNAGVATAADAEVVKRLITQWGGAVQDHVDVDTDFVVMGAEPVVKSSTDSTDPATQLLIEKQKKAAAEYQRIIQDASQFFCPIMNQNRFLYFIGYYDQANR